MQAIGKTTLIWAEIELVLEYANILAIEEGWTKPPIQLSLKDKLKTFRAAHRHADLALLQSAAIDIADRINAAKGTRHSLVHGVVLDQLPSFKWSGARHEYRDGGLNEISTTISLTDIADFISVAEAIAEDTCDHLVKMHDSARPRSTPESYREL